MSPFAIRLSLRRLSPLWIHCDPSNPGDRNRFQIKRWETGERMEHFFLLFWFNGQHSALSVGITLHVSWGLGVTYTLTSSWVLGGLLLISVNFFWGTLDMPGVGLGIESLDEISGPGTSGTWACSPCHHIPLRGRASQFCFDASQTCHQCVSASVREVEKEMESSTFHPLKSGAVNRSC